MFWSTLVQCMYAVNRNISSGQTLWMRILHNKALKVVSVQGRRVYEGSFSFTCLRENFTIYFTDLN